MLIYLCYIYIYPCCYAYTLVAICSISCCYALLLLSVLIAKSVKLLFYIPMFPVAMHVPVVAMLAV